MDDRTRSDLLACCGELGTFEIKCSVSAAKRQVLGLNKLGSTVPFARFDTTCEKVFVSGSTPGLDKTRIKSVQSRRKCSDCRLIAKLWSL